MSLGHELWGEPRWDGDGDDDGFDGDDDYGDHDDGDGDDHHDDNDLKRISVYLSVIVTTKSPFRMLFAQPSLSKST